MIRKAFLMKLLPGQADAYQRRHNPIWPELQKVLHDHGVQRYSIFLHADEQTLFAYAEIESEGKWQAIASDPICQKWWLSMSPLMETHADHSPITETMMEVFCLQGSTT